MPAEQDRVRKKLRLLKEICDGDFERLKECNGTIERLLKPEQKRVGDRAQADTTRLDDEAADLLADMYADERHHLENILPQTLRRSLLVACCSIAEQYLKRLSANFGHLTRDSTTPEEIRDWKIKQHIEYLKKILKDKFPDKSREWKAMDNYRKIRNVIVHADANVKRVRNDKEAKEARSAVEATKGSCVDEQGNIMLSEDFMEHAFATVKGFFALLWDQTMSLRLAEP